MDHSSFTKSIAGLLAALALVLPAGLSASLAFVPAHRAYAFDYTDPLGIGDDILPEGLTTQEEREELGKDLAIATASCAAAAAILKAISEVLAVIPSLQVPMDDKASNFKKNFVDCFFYNVINVLIESILRSLTRWVQSGFNGNPVFVTNMKKIERDIINQMAGEFIGTELEFLCSPFKLDVQLALTAHITSDRQRFQCSLTDVVENVEDFVNGGDFFAGGWDGWYELYLNDNPYTAYLEARDELSLRISRRIAEKGKERDLGRGFLSIHTTQCYLFPLDDSIQGPPRPITLKDGETVQQATRRLGIEGAYTYECDEEKVSTPGAFIEEQIERQFNIPAQRLAFADELNELISAAVMLLIDNIFKNDKGLSDTEQSYWKTYPPIIPDVPIPDTGGGGPTTPSDDARPGPIGATACFEERGAFLSVAPGNEYAMLNLPLPSNTSYNKIILDVDVEHGGWNEQMPDASHALFWLARGKHRNLFGFASARGPGRNILIMRHGVGQVHGAKPRVTRSAQLSPGVTYHGRYVYDAQNRSIEFVLTNKATGAVVSRTTSTPDVPGINVGSQVFKASFSSASVAQGGEPGEPPTYGWTYSDLKVVFEGTGTEPVSCARPQRTGGGGGGGNGAGGGPGDSGGIDGEDDDNLDPNSL